MFCTAFVVLDAFAQSGSETNEIFFEYEKWTWVMIFIPVGIGITFLVIRLRKPHVLCDQEFPVNVSERILVSDCNNKTQAETAELDRRLKEKADSLAQRICTQNMTCTRFQFVDKDVLNGTPDANGNKHGVCRNRLWRKNVRFYYKCVRA